MDRKIEKKFWTWKRLGLIAGIIAIAGLVASAIYKQSGGTRLNVQTERLLLDTVNRGVFQEFIPVTGVVLPIKTVYLDAVEGGKVEEKLVEDGAYVKAGQALIRLSNPDLQLNYLNQEANIVSQINQIRNTSLLMEQQSLNLKEQALNVEYQIDLLSKRVSRNKSLYNDKVIAQVEFEETEDELENNMRRRKLLSSTIQKDSMFHLLQQDQMNSSLDLMKRNLEIARQSLDNLTIKAPIDGQISAFDVELGQSISRSQRVAQLDVLTDYKVRARIDEFYISRVFLDQEGTFTFAGETYRLIIKKIYPQVVNGSFEVDMLFTAGRPDQIKRGQTLNIYLELSAKEEATLLARGGFYQSTGGNWVYVLDPSGNTAVKREIKINRQNPNFYEVTEGLNTGEIVITSSYDNYGNKDILVLQ